MDTVERHLAAGRGGRVAWRRVVPWLCLLVLLCAAAQLWRITSQSMLASVPNAMPTYAPDGDLLAH